MLWYPDPKSPKFLIRRDVAFDESVMVHPRKDVVDKEEDIGETIELESGPGVTFDQLVEEKVKENAHR